MRILIANRGEIARRIIRTAHRLGHETVAVYAEPDTKAPHVVEATMAVAIGPAALDLSYLSVDAVLAAAADADATAVHPGYGFLAENAEFAQACIDRGLTWIGPHPAAIASMGSKIDAREIAERAGVPTIPGWAGSQDRSELAAAAGRIGFPVLIKAAAGGGGRGIRIALSAAELDAAIEEAAAEAERAFGDGSVIVERYIERPRHIEVQVLGDNHGLVVDLGTRECSVQRRYQKLLEEAPAPALAPDLSERIREAARSLASSMGYDSAGTVEFIVDDDSGDFFFLEVNTRLQVEHTVTEMVTGIDLVEAMIASATGEPLPFGPDAITIEGHAFEARILAEDADHGFAPHVGSVHQLVVPTGVRWDAAVEAGSEISPHYDSMIAKLVVHGSDRDDALARMRRALDELIIDGLPTTAGFHRRLLDHQALLDAQVTTRLLDEQPLAPPTDETAHALADAASAWTRAVDVAVDRSSPWRGSHFSVTPHRPVRIVGLTDIDGQSHEVAVAEAEDHVAAVDVGARRVAVNRHGTTHSFTLATRTERWAPEIGSRTSTGTALTAPFPAIVTSVDVTAGDCVEHDQVLVVIEAMKMLHSLRAAGRATIAEVLVAPGDQIATGDELVTFAPEEDS